MFSRVGARNFPLLELGGKGASLKERREKWPCETDVQKNNPSYRILGILQTQSCFSCPRRWDYRKKNGQAAEMYREIILSRHSGDIVSPENRAPVTRNHTQNTQTWSPLT